MPAQPPDAALAKVLDQVGTEGGEAGAAGAAHRRIDEAIARPLPAQGYNLDGGVMSQSQGEGKIKIVVSEQTALGTYANFASIVHNYAEFIIDFGRIVPGREGVQVVSRLVMTPVHAKQLLRALNENVSIYERNYGEIAQGPAPPTPELPTM